MWIVAKMINGRTYYLDHHFLANADKRVAREWENRAEAEAIATRKGFGWEVRNDG